MELTDEQIKFLVEHCEVELCCLSLEDLRQFERELLCHGYTTLYEYSGGFCIKTSKLGRKFIEDSHIISLIEFLSEVGHPEAVKLIGNIPGALLPELLVSRVARVRYFAIKRAEYIKKNGTDR